ncbi:MAG TPA: GGDEF domain-containing protein [Sedimentisphaerales bacterium]|nr:GGDEF domain-containing protein [Sedimentisphaerales bacterium]
METSDSNTQRILLVGDIAGAFSDAEAVRRLPYEVCANLGNALAAATKTVFAAIAVVMSALSSNLTLALRTLRQGGCETKIILLAQMLEEPLAMQLVNSVSDGRNLADDYLICPIDAQWLYETVVSPRDRQPAPVAPPAPAAAAPQMRIRQLEKLATEDDLTGLKNRRYIWEFSRQIIEHARKEDGRVTLLLFDIDNLKSYNDVFGHLAGDEILKEAALLMRRCCRQHDVVARLGGDEFAVVFWDGPRAESKAAENERRSTSAEHPKEAICIAKRFQGELKKAELHLLGPRGRGVLTISGGLASFPRDGDAIDELFQQADRALLEAKRSGKNKIYLVGRPESDIADIE